jgi:hypothetical protein
MAAHTDTSGHRAFSLARRASAGLSGLAVAVVIAAAIPIAWVWIASQLAGTDRDVTPSLAILITAGILVSYWVALLIGSWIRGRVVDPGDELARHRRMSWNRSFRDESPDHSIDPIERIFVFVALIGIVAFEIWFFFFAGSPLPNQPLF